MSYSIDANLLLYASDRSSPEHSKAKSFLLAREKDPDLLCLTWITLLAYHRIATHPSIFTSPLSPEDSWQNITALLALPRVRLIGEEDAFATDYAKATHDFLVRGNLVPDAHLAVILQEHGVKTLYSADTDFRKFDFLKVINPLKR